MIGFGQRRRFLIDRLQYKLLAINMAYLVVAVFFFLVAVFSPVIVDLYASASFDESARAADEFLNLHNRIWPAIVIALILICVHSTIVSHRIAGPLYRFRKVFEAVGEGNLSVYTGIRKRDYLQREAECLCAMVGQLRRRIGDFDTQLSEVRAAHAELSATLGPEHRELLRNLELRIDTLRAQVDGFQLSDEREGGAARRSMRPRPPAAIAWGRVHR